MQSGRAITVDLTSRRLENALGKLAEELRLGFFATSKRGQAGKLARRGLHSGHFCELDGRANFGQRMKQQATAMAKVVS